MTDAMVRAENVYKRFGRLEVLRGVSLEVTRREVLCVIGPSSSGKSAFLRCINHLDPIDSSRLYVYGTLAGYIEREGRLHELAKWEVCRRRAEIGMGFPRFNLFPHRTALENVMEGPVIAKESKAEAEHARARLRQGLADKQDSHPSQRSGCQRRRVTIARALFMRLKLMLFDEPTSALDPE